MNWLLVHKKHIQIVNVGKHMLNKKTYRTVVIGNRETVRYKEHLFDEIHEGLGNW